MEVGGRGECIAMDIVGGKKSLPQTARANTCILTIIDCFTRFEIAIQLPNQTSETITHAILSNYIMVYGTPKRILTDQGRNFESSYFQNFCNYFRINKIRTSGYRSQANGICERFNQSLLTILRKILNKNQIIDWDRYINFETHAYNTSIHSSTGFTPYYLTFGSESRSPPELTFGYSLSTNSTIATTPARGNFSNSTFDYFSVLNDAFQSVRDLSLIHI